MPVLTTKQIMEIIPHRQPMLLIDTIEELEPGKRGVGKKCVSFNEPYFAGHFPNEPVMPGVLTVEALAQVGAVVILSCPEFKGKTAYFGAIKDRAGRCGLSGGGDDPPEGTHRNRKGNSHCGRRGSRVSRADLCDRVRRRLCFRKC